MLMAERDLIPLLGKPMSCIAALAGLPAEHDEHVGETSITWSYRSAGLELSFGTEDGGLETIFLHAAGHEDFDEFAPQLPLGLLYRMKRPRHGSSWLALTPDELLAKLATLVPPPRVHGLRYHGVFAPHARLRSRVVPEPVPRQNPVPSRIVDGSSRWPQRR